MQAEGIFADEFRAPGPQVALEVPCGSMAAVSGRRLRLIPFTLQSRLLIYRRDFSWRGHTPKPTVARENSCPSI